MQKAVCRYVRSLGEGEVALSQAAKFVRQSASTRMHTGAWLWCDEALQDVMPHGRRDCCTTCSGNPMHVWMAYVQEAISTPCPLIPRDVTQLNTPSFRYLQIANQNITLLWVWKR